MTFVVSSPIGKLLAIIRGGQLYSLSCPQRGVQGDPWRIRHPLCGTRHPLCGIQKQFQQYQSGCLTRFKIPLAKHGTIFQQKVWKAISKIPYGQVRSYQWVAKQIGHVQAVRAVGNACAKNPFPIIVPCHRVVAKTHIGGYLYGVKAKQKLLQLEKNYIKQNKPLALSSKNR